MYKEMFKANSKPNVNTYTTLIHSLARTGKVNAANTMFMGLPSLGINPSAVTYTIMIQAFLRAKAAGRALALHEAMRSDGIV